jgi:protein SCO1/2
LRLQLPERAPHDDPPTFEPMNPFAMVRRAFCATLIASLVACGGGGPEFQASDITGASFGREFELKDPDGKPRRLADFRGKAVVVFFGYTQCPDVCPTTLAALADAMKRLGSDADRVQVLFITVDPDRDTPALLAQYVPAFDPRFLGLHGDADATARTAKEFKILYQKVPGSTAGNYTMDHSAGTYIYDPQGRLRLYVSNGQGSDVFAHDLRELLRAG